MACICISGALRSTPSSALNTLLNLPPIDLFGRQVAASAAIRLKSLRMWKEVSSGHSTILMKFGSPPGNTDLTIPKLIFEKNFSTSIPSRSYWTSAQQALDGPLRIFTDGSKMGEGVGAGVYSKDLDFQLSFRLPNHCSVFQAETIAIKEALSWLKNNVILGTDIIICSDSQAAIKSLSAVTFNSKTSYNCRLSLNEMAKYFNITLMWVPGHSDIPENCEADELARKGTTSTLFPDGEPPSMPIATAKHLLKLEMLTHTQRRWSTGTGCLITKQIWPTIDHKRSRNLISTSRPNLRTLIGVITGHCAIGIHASRLGIPYNDFCRSCRDEEEEETIVHFLCNCSALSSRRLKHLSASHFNDLTELNNTSVSHLLSFIKSSNWFAD